MTDVVQADDSECGDSSGEIPARLLSELRAIPAKGVASVNVNVSLVVATVLAVAPKVQALRPDICRVLREVNLAWIDDLEEYALLLNQLHGELLATPRPRGAVAGAVEARTLRRNLTKLLRLWVVRGLIPPERVPTLRGSNGHIAIATDLNVLAKVLSASFSAADPASVATQADLNRARVFAQRLLRVDEDRATRALARKAAADLRARAFTALVRAYEEARWAVTCVRRREGDADAIIPLLFSVRFKRKRSDRILTQSPITGDRPIPRTDEEAGAADDPEPFM